MKRLVVVLVTLALLGGVPGRASADTPNSCGVADPTAVVEGEFAADDEGIYLLVPFEVAAGSTRVRVSLCYDGIDLSNPLTSHTLDLGLYQTSTDAFYDQQEFRGWGGSSRRDAFVTPEDATNGFVPGPIPAGTWAAEIGVGAVASIDEGDLDGTVAWRLEVKVTDDPADADQPWNPPAFDTNSRSSADDWYSGDMHVHAEHSGGASMQATFNYAFDPRPGGAGLDFVTLSDYVTTRHWRELRQFQDAHWDKLILRSAEVITYRGHINNHGSVDWADYRTGDVFRRNGDGTRTLLRGAAANPPSAIFDDIHQHQGWTQVNHPTTFPADIPFLGNFCRGCSWEYDDAETQWQKVDAMEVQTGPAGTYDVDGEPGSTGPVPVETDGLLGPNPFTPLAIEWWDRLHREGYDITAVGSSDSHAVDHQALTQSPIGEATTVVCADELSEGGVNRGVRSGAAYVQFFGSDGPQLDIRARTLPFVEPSQPPVRMGGQITSNLGIATMNIAVKSAREGSTVVVLRDGVPVTAIPMTGPFLTTPYVLTVPGDWRIQIMRGSAIDALSNPITLVTPGHPLSHTHQTPGILPRPAAANCPLLDPNL